MIDANEPQSGGCLRRFFVGLVVLIIIFIALGFAGSIYETQAERAFFEGNPAPGTLVDVGGRNLHIQCMGQGSPTIILDAGQGGWSTDYSDLQQALASQTQVCAYDRAGYGWSDPADDERTVEQIADDLHLLLGATELDTEYVLVAFSFSGLSARYYAEQYPEELAGLVLIDPAHEADSDLLPDDIRAAQNSLIGTYQVFEGAASMSIVRLLNPAEMAPYAPFIPADPVNPDIYYELVAHPDWWATSRLEFMTGLQGDFPGLATSFDMPVRIVGLRNSIPDEAYDSINQDKLEVLQTLADGSSSAELVVFDDIAHEDIIKETELLAGVIDDLLDSIDSE